MENDKGESDYREEESDYYNREEDDNLEGSIRESHVKEEGLEDAEGEEDEDIEDHTFGWDDPQTRTTVQAIYHDHYRSKFIEQQNARGVYDHEPDSGTLPADVTCFHAEYEHCGPDRSDWPRILYQYKPDDQCPCRVKPGRLLTPEGYVVLNTKNEPLLDFPSIPLTISSECKGWMLEAFSRSNKWATIKQIRSRMLGATNPRDGNLSMRMTRFRRKAGAITWGPAGEQSDAFADYIDQKLPQACEAANSIKAFRDLHPHEIAEMELRNVGRCPERARGTKNMSSKKLEQKRAAALREYNRLLAKFNAEHGQAAGEVDVDNEKEEETEEEYEEGEYEEGEYEEGEKAEEDGQWEWEDGDERLSIGDVGDSKAEASPGDDNLFRYEDQEDDSQEKGSDRSDPGSIEASDSDVGNLLYENPTTAAESQLIQRLLVPTMTHFVYLMGHPPPPTDPNRSYIHQWGDIVTFLGQQFDDSVLPPPAFLLIGLIVFTVDTAEWNMPWDEERYGARLDLEGLDVAVFAERALGEWS